MMEMSAEATVAVLENLLKHGKYNIVTRNAMENAVRLLKQIDAPAVVQNGENNQHIVNNGTMNIDWR